MYICAAYIPPEYTTANIRNRADYFQELTDAILKYSAMGSVLITGDLNSRISFLDMDNESFEIPHLENLGFIERSNEPIPKRSTCDHVTNRFGKKLKDLCTSLDLHIANGRVPGDRVGNFTCHNNRGSSVVDYVICDHNLFKKVKRLTMLEPSFGSIHTPLSLSFSCEFSITNSTRDSNMVPYPPKLVWDPNNQQAFKEMLKLREFQDVIGTIDGIVSNQYCTGNGVGEATKLLTDSLFEQASKCFKLAKKGKRSHLNKPKKKLW